MDKTTKITTEQYQYLKELWGKNYPPKEMELSEWMRYLLDKKEIKHQKNLALSLDYLYTQGVPVISFLEDYKNERMKDAHPVESPLKYHYGLFNCVAYCVKKGYIALEDINLDDYIIRYQDTYHSSSVESKKNIENKISLLCIYPASEKILDKILECYENIHLHHEFDLQAQKKLLNFIDKNYKGLLSGLPEEKAFSLNERINTLCSGIVQKADSLVQVNGDIQHSFAFTFTVDNTNKNAFNIFGKSMELYKEFMVYFTEKMQASPFVMNMINNNPKLGPLKFQYILFANTAETIEEYKNVFNLFNQVVARDKSQNLHNDFTHYQKIFETIQFKSKMDKDLPDEKTKIKPKKI